jgi:hypothetical protein
MNEADAKVHEEILDEWQQRVWSADMIGSEPNNSFFPDGVIDRKRWNEASVRILFLNKEAHDSDNTDSGGFPLPELIRDVWEGHPKCPTYSNIAIWAHGIHEAIRSGLHGLPRWDKIQDDADVVVSDFLSTAVVNIKKRGGKSTSNSADLKRHVDVYGDLLRRQVNLINPDLIITGSVWYLVRHLWSSADNLFDSVWRHGSKTIVDYWHPANRADKQMKYYALDSLLRGAGFFANFQK